MPTPIVPGGVTSPTKEEIEAKRLAEEEEAKRKEEEEANRKKEESEKEEEEKIDKKEEEIDENKFKTIVITTDEGDIEYEIDENGNAVKDGNIVYTKEQLSEFEKNDETEEFTVSNISEISGISPLDSEGNPKEYEMTIEGLAQRDADIIELGRKQGEENAISNFFKANPDIYKAALYKQTYGSLDGFANHVDWSEIQLDNADDNQLETIIRSAEKRKGTSDKQIDRIIKYSKADNILKDVAQESVDYLASVQKQEIELAERQKEAQIKEAQDTLDKVYGVTYDDQGKLKVLNIEGSLYDKIVNKGIIGGLQIPTAGVKVKINNKDEIISRRDLIRYLTEPSVEIDGAYYTKAQKAMFDMLSDNDTFAIMAIKALLGNDINQLAEATIRTEAVRRLNISSKNNKIKFKSSKESDTKINKNRKPIVPGGIIDSH